MVEITERRIDESPVSGSFLSECFFEIFLGIFLVGRKHLEIPDAKHIRGLSVWAPICLPAGQREAHCIAVHREHMALGKVSTDSTKYFAVYFFKHAPGRLLTSTALLLCSAQKCHKKNKTK